MAVRLRGPAGSKRRDGANCLDRDGRYGLWLDDSFEKGVSSSCPTFGNEPLSDEGTKFDVLGVEVWYIGS